MLITAALTAALAATPDQDLAITYHPGVTGNIGWTALPTDLPLHLLGSPGARILDLSDGLSKDPLLHRVQAENLANATLADTSLVLDETAACDPALKQAVDHQHPTRLLLAFPAGITPGVVQCLDKLPTDALFLAGCLYRAHRPEEACDGDAEIARLAADNSLRPRVLGLAVSPSTSTGSLGSFPGLVALALSPGPGAADRPLLLDLPFQALGNLRILEAAGENDPVTLSDSRGLAFVAHLRVLRWSGRLGAPLPTSCALERAEFETLGPADVAALTSCGGLRELASDDVHLEAVELLSALGQLERLHLRHLHAPALDSLGRLTHVVALDLPAADASDWSFLAKLPALVELDLSQTSLRDLSFVRGLSALSHLDVSDTGVQDLSPLATLVHLERLDVAGTAVADLAPIAGLVEMRELIAGKTAVADLGPLAGMVHLERAIFYDTHVADATPLSKLPALKAVYLQGTTVPADQLAALHARPGLDVIP